MYRIALINGDGYVQEYHDTPKAGWMPLYAEVRDLLASWDMHLKLDGENVREVDATFIFLTGPRKVSTRKLSPQGWELYSNDGDDCRMGVLVIMDRDEPMVGVG